MRAFWRAWRFASSVHLKMAPPGWKCAGSQPGPTTLRQLSRRQGSNSQKRRSSLKLAPIHSPCPGKPQDGERVLTKGSHTWNMRGAK